jgi:hypothetical protein
MTGDLFVVVAVVVVVAMVKKMEEEGTERAQASDEGTCRFCRFSVEAVKYSLSDTQQHSLSLNDPVYVSTVQQASGTARGRW